MVRRSRMLAAAPLWWPWCGLAGDRHRLLAGLGRPSDDRLQLQDDDDYDAAAAAAAAAARWGALWGRSSDVCHPSCNGCEAETTSALDHPIVESSASVVPNSTPRHPPKTRRQKAVALARQIYIDLPAFFLRLVFVLPLAKSCLQTPKNTHPKRPDCAHPCCSARLGWAGGRGWPG